MHGSEYAAVMVAGRPDGDVSDVLRRRDVALAAIREQRQRTGDRSLNSAIMDEFGEVRAIRSVRRAPPNSAIVVRHTRSPRPTVIVATTDADRLRRLRLAKAQSEVAAAPAAAESARVEQLRTPAPREHYGASSVPRRR